MRGFSVVAASLVMMAVCGAEVFKHEVTTEKKPWTHENFGGGTESADFNFIVFGDGNDTLILDGGHLLTTGTITGLTNLTVTGNTGTLGQNLILSGSETAITYDGNLQGAGSEKAISVSDSTVTFKTADGTFHKLPFGPVFSVELCVAFLNMPVGEIVYCGCDFFTHVIPP